MFTLNHLVASHCRSLPSCSFFVFIQPSLSRAGSCQNPLQCIDIPVLLSEEIECPLFLFITPLILAVGYNIAIIPDVKLVNIFLGR